MKTRTVKYVGLILSLTALLSGCAGTAKSQTADKTPDITTGGYTVNKNLSAAALPKDAQGAFDKALDGMTGADYEPIVLIGTQTVSGTNYAILCKVTPVIPDAESELDVVTIYEDLSGKAEILSTEPFDLAEVTDTDQTYSKDDTMVGGFSTNTEFTAQETDDTVMKVFNQAENADKSYHYAAELGTQSVSGTNYAFLALKEDNKDSDSAVWTVLTVYEDLDNKVSLSSAYELDPGAYTTYGETEAD